MHDEDHALLRYAGLMGHLFCGIGGKPGERRVVCETNTLQEAQRLVADPLLRVYSTSGGKRRRTYLCCYDRAMDALAKQIKPE